MQHSGILAFSHPFSRSFIRGDPQVRAATWNAPRREFWRLEYAKITQSSASGGGWGFRIQRWWPSNGGLGHGSVGALVWWCSLVALATSNISRVKPPVCRLIDKRFPLDNCPWLTPGTKKVHPARLEKINLSNCQYFKRRNCSGLGHSCGEMQRKTRGQHRINPIAEVHSNNCPIPICHFPLPPFQAPFSLPLSTTFPAAALCSSMPFYTWRFTNFRVLFIAHPVVMSTGRDDFKSKSW